MRSTGRAKELGEVFTGAREVKAMLDMIPDMFASLDSKFLEPACGDGNFLIEILERKLAQIDARDLNQQEFEFSILRAITSIYGIDISEENVAEARQRLSEIVAAFHTLNDFLLSVRFVRVVSAVLSTNVVVADALLQAKELLFVDYTPSDGHSFERTLFFLEESEPDLFFVPPAPLNTVHYLELAKDA